MTTGKSVHLVSDLYKHLTNYSLFKTGAIGLETNYQLLYSSSVLNYMLYIRERK